MKTLICFIFFLITLNSTNIFAQVTLEPLRLNKNFLVHSAGLPEEFLLFTTDSVSQILFNPARANNVSTNFIYLNYLSDYIQPSYYYSYLTYESGITISSLSKRNVYSFPSIYEETYTSSKNPTFSIASLINDGEVKWLLSLSNGINSSESKNNSISEENRDQSYSGSVSNVYQITENSSEYDDEVLITTLKISRIWEAGMKNYSIGAFGIIYRNNHENKSIYSSTRESMYNSLLDNSEQISFYQANSNVDGEQNDSKFAVGVEITTNSANWDYIGSLSYQKNNMPENLSGGSSQNRVDSSLYSDSTQWQVNRNIQNILSNYDLKKNPYVFSLENYFQKSVDWITQSDNYFISLNAFYSQGDITYHSFYKRVQTSYYNDVLNYSDTTEQRQSDNTNAKSWGLYLSTGYALTVSLDDIFFLSGIRLNGSYNKTENVLGSSSSYAAIFREFTSKNTSGSITLPIYINYSPAKWVSIYGGFNYVYQYVSNRTDYNNILVVDNSVNSDANLNTNSTSESSSWKSGKSIYLGCEFRHQSGLKIQFFFKENFASIRDWNVSVGYHF